jgi:hypothetical protein
MAIIIILETLQLLIMLLRKDKVFYLIYGVIPSNNIPVGHHERTTLIEV